MENEFKPGDVVILKSGGPKMTISSISGEAKCVWFNDSERKEGYFPLPTLYKIDDSDVEADIAAYL